MGWLAGGVVYSIVYALAGALLRDEPTALSWFRATALIIPPLVGAIAIVARRHVWSGCQWLFWSTIALGLTMSAIGLTGWAAEELMLARETWLAWPAVFALFGAVAPLFALLAQPHRGTREPLAATTAVDIAGLAVVTGFLYSFFVTSADSDATISLLAVSELQQALVFAGMTSAALIARRTAWADTYRRLAFGALVSFVTLTLSNLEAGRGAYRSAFVYDFTWILPFAFYPWAARSAPESPERESAEAEGEELVRPRPWVIFTAVALIPFLDFALRSLTPQGPEKGVRDLSTAVTVISVLPLLVARIAAERAELQQAGSTVRLMAQVIEQAGDLMLVLTPDGRCRHANDAFCRATGYTREELARMQLDLVSEDPLVSALDIDAQVAAGGRWHGVLIRTRRDGSTFPSAATIAAVTDERGRMTHIVSVERDVSTERELRQQLIHSERLSAVGQLISGVAHELNNPLQSVIGRTELLLDDERREPVRRDLEQVRIDAERAARIVRNLLTFVRRSPADRARVDLNDIARSALALRDFVLQRAHISVEERYTDGLPRVTANREEIQQVVLNLLLNAEQALQPMNRRGTIRLRTGRTDEGVFLEVSDDGPGVPSALQGRVFEPFFTTKGVGQGTGLGLSISLGIAEAHGGALVLAPSERGACFRLTLPLTSAAQPDSRAAMMMV